MTTEIDGMTLCRDILKQLYAAGYGDAVAKAEVDWKRRHDGVKIDPQQLLNWILVCGLTDCGRRVDDEDKSGVSYSRPPRAG